ncbi:MAG: ABC transporter ATP-binding protein [Candidatus Krumholzibacteriota bacterium]|nr:ABC transporter ATP-binding protein [Candidatus Krumholzibacteriota bacterium]
MNISINGLNMVYKGGKRALDDVNLEIGSGMFGLLGPNGAGKTTLIRILVTLMKASSGNISFGSLDILRNRREIRSMLGYLPQDFRFFSKLKTWEFLDYVASLAGLKNKATRTRAVDEMLEQVGLFDVRDRQANKLSGGMKRRLGIAQALIGDPKIIVVDEPTTGLDPEERIRFRNLIADMGHRNVTIILSTHIVGDISSTCHNMALLDGGRVVFRGAPTELITMTRGHVWRIEAVESELEDIKSRYSVISTFPSTNGWEVDVVGKELDGYPGTEIDPNLEHAYVYFMEHNTTKNN